MSTTALEKQEFTEQELEELTSKVFNFTELFCFTEPGTGFYPYQITMAKAILKDVLANLGNTLTGLFARQSGKSETVADVAAALMVILPKLARLTDEEGKRLFPALFKFRNGYYVGVFAPSSLQAGTTYKRIRDRLTSSHAKVFLQSQEFALEGYTSLWPPISNTGTYFELNNGSLCMQMTAEKTAKIESKTYHLILYDESQDLDQFVVGKSIAPMGASTNATSVATGTPGFTKSFFYNQIKENELDELQIRRHDRRTQPQLHFENDYRIVQKYNPDYKKHIAKEKKRIGEESDEFQMAYCLKWLLERGMAVPDALFDELSIKNKGIQSQYKGEDLVAGLDWGKGEDSTVLTIGKPHWEAMDENGRMPVEVIYWWEKVGDNYENIIAALKDELSQFSIMTLAADATGVGEPLADRLTIELPYITVVPVKFSAQSKDHIYKNFLLTLQEKMCTWPADPYVRERKYFKKFKNEMLNLVKEYKNGYLSCHAPVDQVKAHDDFPDSLALMLWCLNSECMPFIEISDANALYEQQSWHKPERALSITTR